MFSLLRKLIRPRSPLRMAWYRAKAFLAALLYRFPARHLTVIGVTGTDGKTTTTAMITDMLQTAGLSVGSASTAFLRVNGELRENASHLTSLSPFVLQAFLRELVQHHCTHAVIEMSSHGLVQHRLDYTWPRVAVITNTSLEHLDYHGTMEQYRADKAILFRMLKGRGTKVLNVHDATYATYRGIPSQNTIVFSTQAKPTSMPNTDSMLFMTDVSATADSSRGLVHETAGATSTDADLTLHIPGVFNLENALAAMGAARACGIPLPTCITALAHFTGIPGRMEEIDEGQSFRVYVDFAVSPQSYQRVLETLREIVGEGHRVLVLCSSCGNRMREKRPEIGHVCSKLADVVVVTEDETYGEDPHAVLEEVWAGVDQTKTDAQKIFDRREAITFLLQKARPGDAVVLCSMGPFSTMTKLEGRVPWDERAIARETLRRLASPVASAQSTTSSISRTT